MSSESYVNRVHQGPYVELEGKKLESAPVGPTEVPAAVEANFDANGSHVDDPTISGVPSDEFPEPGEVIQDWSMSPAAKAAGHVSEEMIKVVPLIDQLLDNQVAQEEMAKQGLEPNEDLLASFRALVGSEDQKVFRSQVIRAFKHIGLDTKKFFGE